MTVPALKSLVAVCIGKAAQPLGQLTYVKDGDCNRSFSTNYGQLCA